MQIGHQYTTLLQNFSNTLHSFLAFIWQKIMEDINPLGCRPRFIFLEFLVSSIKTGGLNQIMEKFLSSSSEQTQNCVDRFKLKRQNDRQIAGYKSYKEHMTYKHQTQGCSYNWVLQHHCRTFVSVKVWQYSPWNKSTVFHPYFFVLLCTASLVSPFSPY